jgi:hypothetical protein
VLPAVAAPEDESRSGSPRWGPRRQWLRRDRSHVPAPQGTPPWLFYRIGRAFSRVNRRLLHFCSEGVGASAEILHAGKDHLTGQAPGYDLLQGLNRDGTADSHRFSNQPISQGEERRLEPALNPQLGEDVLDVIARGGGANKQLGRDGPGRRPSGQEAEHLSLTARQLRCGGCDGRVLLLVRF